MTRRTVEDMNRLWNRPGSDRAEWRMTFHSPADAGEYLFVSSSAGCLTHIIRWVATQPERAVHGTTHPANRLYQALCGVASSTNRGVSVIAPDDEMFGCHRCLNAAARYDLPTYQLLPSTGCQATEGARWRPVLKRNP